MTILSEFVSAYTFISATRESFGWNNRIQFMTLCRSNIRLQSIHFKQTLFTIHTSFLYHSLNHLDFFLSMFKYTFTAHALNKINYNLFYWLNKLFWRKVSTPTVKFQFIFQKSIHKSFQNYKIIKYLIISFTFNQNQKIISPWPMMLDSQSHVTVFKEIGIDV